MDKSPADVLEEAADLLLIYGRARGDLRRESGEFCALGALIAAAAGDDTLNRSQIASAGFTGPYVGAFSALCRHLKDSIPRWNNDPATTDDDVRDTFLLVAKDLRNEAAQ